MKHIKYRSLKPGIPQYAYQLFENCGTKHLEEYRKQWGDR